MVFKTQPPGVSLLDSKPRHRCALHPQPWLSSFLCLLLLQIIMAHPTGLPYELASFLDVSPQNGVWLTSIQ